MSKPIFIPLAAGLQTELTDQLVQPGATLITENCYSEQTGQTHVRFGADVLSTSAQGTIPSGGTLPAVWQLATLEGELVRLNRAPVPIHAWANTPALYAAPSSAGTGLISYHRGPLKLDRTPVVSQSQVNETVMKPTVATAGDVIVEVCQTKHGSAFATMVTILDRTTRKPLYTRQTGTGTVTPRVAIVGTIAVVAYENGTNLIVDSYNLATFTNASTATLGAVLSGTAIDIRVGAPGASAGNVGILYREAGGKLRCAVVLATNLATNSTITIKDTAVAEVAPNLGFGWLQDLGASGKYAVMAADTTNGLRVLWDLPTPTASVSTATRTDVIDSGATAVPASSTPGLRNVIGSTVTASASGQYRIMYEFAAPLETTKAQVIGFVCNAGSVTAEPSQIRSVGIRSKLWLHATGLYFLAAWDGEDQKTYFVLRTFFGLTTDVPSSAPLGVVMPRDAGGITEATNSPSDVAVGTDGEIYIAATSEVRSEQTEAGGTASGAIARILAVELVRVRHPATAETEVGRPAEFIKSLFVPGGNFMQFDGMTYAMAGFPYYPPPVGAVAANGGNLTADAAYLHVALFSFVDRNGRKWRSAPSVPVQTTLSGADQSVTVTIETLRLFDRGTINLFMSAGFEIEVYRTQANSVEGFFMVAAIGNDPTVTTDDLSFVDSVADTALGEQLYTDGNGLENQLLPPIACAVEWQGRLVTSESGAGTLWYSVEADLDHGLIFSETLTLDVGDPSDPITGLAVYNETLFAFKAGKIYVVSGQGANAIGQGATYSSRLIDGSIGCSNPQSICVADDGVWFRATSNRAGIHRTIGGVAEYVGQGVRAYDPLTITSAVVVRSTDEIRFFTLEGTTLIWNWTTKMWGTNTAQTCLSATAGYAEITGVVYANNVDGAIMAEADSNSTAAYVEGGTNYSARVSSPWYQAAGIEGWERVRRIQGVGEGGSAHRAVINLYKNMETTPFQSASIVFDGSYRPRWDWELRPEQQKYSALRIEVLILPYQAPNVVIVPGTDVYNGLDVDTGYFLWTFENASFTGGDVGDALTIAGATGYTGTYTIVAVINSTQVALTPAPAGSPGAVVATSIYITPALLYTAGPGIVGVSLLPAVKEGMDKLPAARRAT